MSDERRASGTTPNDKKLDQAINRVYRKYGSDLALFFSTVCAQVKSDSARSARTDSRFLKSR
jgi:hypothetical protein